MKHLKRFIILAVVLGIGSLLLMRTPATQFRGQDSLELTRHYNSIKAEDINSRAIELYIDDQKFERDDSDKIWMSDNMALMVPGDLVNDLFRCTVAWLDDGKIELTKDKKQWIIDTRRNLFKSMANGRSRTQLKWMTAETYAFQSMNWQIILATGISGMTR